MKPCRRLSMIEIEAIVIALLLLVSAAGSILVR